MNDPTPGGSDWAMQLIRAADCRRQRWKNDGGWTTEIARDPLPGGDPSAFRWRISIAEIEADGPFSAFPGITRDLLLLAGNGIELRIGGDAPLELVRRYARVHFDGALPVQCRLLDGPTRDFNVMARSDAVQVEVLARPLAGTMVVPPEHGVEWLVHVAVGTAGIRQSDQAFSLSGGDSLHMAPPPPGAGRVLIEGGGELVLVKLRRVGTDPMPG